MAESDAKKVRLDFLISEFNARRFQKNPSNGYVFILTNIVWAQGLCLYSTLK